jgi:hypothetical protein
MSPPTDVRVGLDTSANAAKLRPSAEAVVIGADGTERRCALHAMPARPHGYCLPPRKLRGLVSCEGFS